MNSNKIACNQVSHNSSAIIAVCMNLKCQQNAAACVECLTTLHSDHAKECYSRDKINEMIAEINKQFNSKVMIHFQKLEEEFRRYLGKLNKTLIEFGQRFESLINLTDMNKLRKQLGDYQNTINFQNSISDALIQNTESMIARFSHTISLIKSTYEIDLIKVNSIQCPLCFTSDPSVADLLYENLAIKCSACGNLIICLTCQQKLDDFEVDDHFNLNGQFKCNNS